MFRLFRARRFRLPSLLLSYICLISFDLCTERIYDVVSKILSGFAYSLVLRYEFTRLLANEVDLKF